MRKRYTGIMALLLLFFLNGTSFLSAQQTNLTNVDREKAILGVRVAPLNEQVRSIQGITVKTGVVIKHVLPETPAGRAGLQSFDVIRSVNGSTVTSVPQLSERLGSIRAGDRFRLTIFRDGREKQVKVLPIGRENDTPEKTASNSSNRQTEKKMEQILGEMKKIEQEKENVEKTKRTTARSTEELREKMKSFLEKYSAQLTGNERKDTKKEKSDDERSTVGQLMDRIMETIESKNGDKLNQERLKQFLKSTRQWIKEASEKDLRAMMNRMLKKAQERVRELKGSDLDRLKKWKEAARKSIQKEMQKWEKRIDQKLEQFRENYENQLKRYNRKLEKQIQKLNELKEEVQQLSENQHPEKEREKRSSEKPSNQPYLGVRPAPAPNGKGILIRQVESGSPAEQAGLKKGDIIRKLNGSAIKDLNNLQKRFYRNKPGDKIKLLVERDGWKRTIEIKLERASEERNSDESKHGHSHTEDGASAGSVHPFTELIPLENGDTLQNTIRLMNSYQRGEYLQVAKLFLDRMKNEIEENSLYLHAQVTLINRTNGNVLFSLPLENNLSSAYHRLNRVLSILSSKK